MKIIEHGNTVTNITIKCTCENCHCKFEAEEHELEGNTSRFCWCPECKETVWVPENEVTRSIEAVVIARIKNS